MSDLRASRRFSPTSQPGVGTARLLARQVGSEVTRYRRVPEYFIGVVVLPVILFAMFSLPIDGDVLPGGRTVLAMLFVSFAAMASSTRPCSPSGPSSPPSGRAGGLAA